MMGTNQAPVLDAVKPMKDYELLHCAFRAKGAVGDENKNKSGPRGRRGRNTTHAKKQWEEQQKIKKEAEGSMPANLFHLLSFHVKHRLRLVRLVSPVVKRFPPTHWTLQVSADSRESGWRWCHQVRLSLSHIRQIPQRKTFCNAHLWGMRVIFRAEMNSRRFILVLNTKQHRAHWEQIQQQKKIWPKDENQLKAEHTKMK